MRKLHLRAATPQDAGTVAAHRYPGEEGEHVAAYARWLLDAFSSGIYHGWLALAGPQIIGGAGLVLLPWGPSRADCSPLRGRVVNVFVKVPYRRQGVARLLLEQVLADARRRSLGTLSLGAAGISRALYASLGFHASETEMTLHLTYPGA